MQSDVCLFVIFYFFLSVAEFLDTQGLLSGKRKQQKAPGLGQFNVVACVMAPKSFKLKIEANKYSYFRQKTVLILICKY